VGKNAYLAISPTTANSNTTCTYESPIVKKHATTATEGKRRENEERKLAYESKREKQT